MSNLDSLRTVKCLKFARRVREGHHYHYISKNRSNGENKDGKHQQKRNINESNSNILCGCQSRELIFAY
jgi:hypothetical protein